MTATDIQSFATKPIFAAIKHTAANTKQKKHSGLRLKSCNSLSPLSVNFFAIMFLFQYLS